MSEAEKYLESNGLEKQYGIIEITFEGFAEHLERFEYEQSKLKNHGDISESLLLEMLDSLEEMNLLIGHLIHEKVKFYSNDKKQIRKMQELIGKARKHYPHEQPSIAHSKY